MALVIEKSCEDELIKPENNQIILAAYTHSGFGLHATFGSQSICGFQRYLGSHAMVGLHAPYGSHLSDGLQFPIG
jgi:hypothetical protein